MRVYIAAPWNYRELAKAASSLVEAAGHTITWPWWDHECGDEDHAQLAELAWKDFRGVVGADVLLLLNYAKSEGKAVEQGIALLSGIPIIGVGPHPTCIFHHVNVYTWVNTVEEAIERLRA